MGADPISAPALIALTLATTAATAGTQAAVAADQQRRQTNQGKDAAKRQKAAKAENDRQRLAQLSVEEQKAVRTSQQISGRIRTVAAEAGVGTAGSYAALDNQSAIDSGRTLSNLSMSASFANQASQTQLDNSLAEIAARNSSSTAVVAQGLQGAFSGFSTGLSIGSAYNGVVNANEANAQQQELLRLRQLQPSLTP